MKSEVKRLDVEAMALLMKVDSEYVAQLQEALIRKLIDSETRSANAIEFDKAHDHAVLVPTRNTG